MTEISVVTTVYNSKKFIQECVKSIKLQSFENCEHIIVDDGSTDKGLDFLENENSKKIRILFAGKVGRAKALNIGLEHSKGKYIAILDADDIAMKDRLSLQFQYLENNPSVDLVCSNVALMNENGDSIGESHLPQDHLELKAMLFALNPFAHSSIMFKKEWVAKVGAYNERCLKSIDFNFYLDLLAAGAKFHGESKCLTKLRSYENSWGKSDKSALQLKYAILGLINFYVREHHGSGFLRGPEENWNKVFDIFSHWFNEKKLANKWEAKKTFRKALGQYKKAHFSEATRSLLDAFKQDPALLFYRGSGFNYHQNVDDFLNETNLFFSSNNEHNIK